MGGTPYSPQYVKALQRRIAAAKSARGVEFQLNVAKAHPELSYTNGYSFGTNASNSDYARNTKLAKKIGFHTKPVSGDGSGEGSPTAAVMTYNAKELIYNVGCVRDAYFSKHVSFAQELVPTAVTAVGDTPTTITQMEELWKKAGTNKGMISLFIPKDQNSGTDAVVSGSNANNFTPSEHHRYGFQFHYNPTKISMEYAGAPNTDVGLQVSGNEGFNLVGSQVSQSTVSFDLVLNRVSDMKYYDSTGHIKPEYKTSDARGALYSPKMPETKKVTTKKGKAVTTGRDEEYEIWSKGTMYDVEFLLSTIIGYRLATKFRGTTADVGWLSGRPVEVNLGKSLRYLGFINSFSIQHSIFNERMVPVFSTVSISFNRIPDYSGM
jgi:hypothetical protein